MSTQKELREQREALEKRITTGDQKGFDCGNCGKHLAVPNWTKKELSDNHKRGECPICGVEIDLYAIHITADEYSYIANARPEKKQKKVTTK